MNQAVEVQTPQAAIANVMDDVIARGDLSKLTHEQRVTYYNKVCQSLGLNPLTQPFKYITLQGQLRLYATRDCADQLRKLNGISVALPDRSVHDGLLTVHACATDKTGRTDEDFGVVSIVGLKGEAAANAFLKAVTKAKRRVTLSIAGLGFLDESEVGVIEEEPRTQQFAPPPRDMISTGRPEPRREPDQQAQHEAREREANEPCEIGRNDDSDETWSTWATLLMGYVRAAPDVDTINNWLTSNAEHLAALKKYDTDKYARLVDMVNNRIRLHTGPG